MKTWMKKENVFTVPNLEHICFEVMKETELTLKRLPQTHKGHETCLYSASQAVKKALEGDGINDVMMRSVVTSCTHHIGLNVKTKPETGWVFHFDIWTWHIIFGVTQALRVAAGFDGTVISLDTDGGMEVERVEGWTGVLKGLVRALTFLSVLRHCADNPDATYKSQVDPESIDNPMAVPGYRAITDHHPQWLVAALDAGIVPGQVKTSDFVLPREKVA